MSVATITLVVLAAGLLLYAWRRGDGSHRRGVELGWLTMRRTLPLLLASRTFHIPTTSRPQRCGITTTLWA